MTTMREKMLFDSWRKLRKRKAISMDELDDLMYQVEKLLQNYRETVESREKWKAKYKEVKDEQKRTEKAKAN